LPGKVDPASIDPRLSPFNNFVKQMVFQHVGAYLQLMGVEELSGELQPVRDSVQLFGSQGGIATFEQNLARRMQMAALRGNPLT
jgi:hypothetical protein